MLRMNIWIIVCVIFVSLVPAFPADPVNHRVKDGSVYNITVDTTKTLVKANRRLMGISFGELVHNYAGPYGRNGKWFLNEFTTNALKELHLPLTRFYGVDDDPWSITESLDKAAELAGKLGIQQNNIVLQLEPNAAHATKATFTPADWAKAVKYSVGKKYGFDLWEVQNEPYMGGKAYTAKSYTDQVINVSKAVKAVQPEAKIGLAISQTGGKGSEKEWRDGLIQNAAGYYDFVCPHYYSFNNNAHAESFETLVLGENYKKFETIKEVRNLIDKANPAKKVEVIDTEWALHTETDEVSDPEYNNINGNVIGALHRAVRLIYYIRESIMEGASQWMLLVPRGSPGFGVIPMKGNKLFIHYYLNYYFGRYVGDEVVDISGTCPFFSEEKVKMPVIPTLVTKSSDGKTLFIIAANGTEKQTLVCNINLKGFKAGKAKGIKLTQTDLKAPALVDKESDIVSPTIVDIRDDGGSIKFTSPAHSVSFITLNEKGAK